MVCEASVDTYSVTKRKNVLGAERNLFKIPKTDMIKSLKLFFQVVVLPFVLMEICK